MKSTYPTSHLMNPAFKYVSAASTDLKATFERIKAEQQKVAPKVFKIRSAK